MTLGDRRAIVGPMGPLIACPACSNHVLAREVACPHCGATMRSAGMVGRTASAVLMGLALAGCPADDDDNDTMASTGSSGSPTTDPSESTSSEGSSTDPTAMTTGPLYGGPATGELTSSTSDSSSTGGETEGTSSGSTSLSPDYGVPTTSGE